MRIEYLLFKDLAIFVVRGSYITESEDIITASAKFIYSYPHLQLEKEYCYDRGAKQSIEDIVT